VLITADILKKIATSANGIFFADQKAAHWAGLLNAICPTYGITDRRVIEQFLPQILHESDCFRIKEESLYYTHAERLVAVWPSRFRNTMVAGPFLKNPEKLANYVYGKRMGNINAGDGFLFRGRGPLQTTGRDSYTAYFNYKKAGRGYPVGNLPATVEELAPLLATSDEWGLDSAAWEFAIAKRLIPVALASDFKQVTKVINGGLIGLADREYYYQRAKQYLPAEPLNSPV
jgi:putative chitinase